MRSYTSEIHIDWNINQQVIPACHRDGHISRNSHVILDQLEPDKPLICIPQNNCGPLKEHTKNLLPIYKRLHVQNQENVSKVGRFYKVGQNNHQPGSGFLSGWYWIESLLYAFLISESVAPYSNPRILNGSKISTWQTRKKRDTYLELHRQSITLVSIEISLIQQLRISMIQQSTSLLQRNTQVLKIKIIYKILPFYY